MPVICECGKSANPFSAFSIRPYTLSTNRGKKPGLSPIVVHNVAMAAPVSITGTSRATTMFAGRNHTGRAWKYIADSKEVATRAPIGANTSEHSALSHGCRYGDGARRPNQITPTTAAHDSCIAGDHSHIGFINSQTVIVTNSALYGDDGLSRYPLRANTASITAARATDGGMPTLSPYNITADGRATA